MRLSALAAGLRRPSSRDEVLHSLLRHVGPLGRACLWLRHPTRTVLTLLGNEAQEMPLGAPTPCARSYLERRPIVEPPPTPTIALPLFEARRVIGVLTLARDGHGTAFQPEEIQALEMAIDVTSLALSSSAVAGPTEADQARADAMASVAAEICSSEDLDQMVERTLAMTDKMFGAERAAVWLLENGVPARAIHHGLPDEFVHAVTESFGRNVNWMSLQALRPVLIRDLSDARAATLRDFAKRAGLRSCLIIPLGFRNQLVGALGLYSANFWPWTDEDVAMARSFGLQLGGAVAHSRLLAETRRQLARLDALAEVGRAAVEAVGLEGRSRRVMRALVRSGEVDMAAIYLIDPLKGDLALVAHYPMEFEPRERVAMSEDLMLTRAITGGRLVSTDDDIPDSTRGQMTRRGISHGACMPLVQRGKVRGVIAVARKSGRLSKDALDFVRAVADQLVGSIEVGRVFDEHAATSARLRSILACAPDGMLVMSAQGTVAFANAKVNELLGFEQDITGWSARDFMREMKSRLEDPEVAERIRRQMTEEPNQQHREEFVLARPIRRRIERMSAPVLAEDGQHIGHIIVYHELKSSRA